MKAGYVPGRARRRIPDARCSRMACWYGWASPGRQSITPRSKRPGKGENRVRGTMKTSNSILPNAWHVFGPVKKDDPLPAFKKPAAGPARLKVGGTLFAAQKGPARKGRLDLAPFTDGAMR